MNIVNVKIEPDTVSELVKVCDVGKVLRKTYFVWQNPAEGHTLFVGVSRLHSYGRGLQVYFACNL